MAKKRIIEVKGVKITITQKSSEDFISLTDIASGFEGTNALIEKWIRNKNTIEFLAVWEQLYNPDFNSLEFEEIRKEAGTNRFIMSAKQWTQKTNAVGIVASAGRYGGTYAHKDIAVEFCSWISPEFKLLLIREFQRLKEEEANRLNQVWDLQRALSKINYRFQTDAIKQDLLPISNIEEAKQYLVYADEADLLNIAVFGMTAKEWREANKKAVEKKLNIRDIADLHQLIVLSNLESYNSIMIKNGIPKEERLLELIKIAEYQLGILKEMADYTLDKLKSPNQKLLEDKDEV
jgi:hypothetical protein